VNSIDGYEELAAGMDSKGGTGGGKASDGHGIGGRRQLMMIGGVDGQERTKVCEIM
jgi:hypothetical protein